LAYCAEDLAFVDWSRAEKAAAGTRLATYLIDQPRLRRGRAAPCRPRIETGQSSIPALLMSGRRDPVTPPRVARRRSDAATRARPSSPAGGHGTDGLIRAIAASAFNGVSFTPPGANSCRSTA
jgi:pimeloyl-ACP methyl ester carboxylesterase